MIKAALFDLDGVIVDTEPQYTIFWRRVGHKYFPDDENFATNLKGQTLSYINDTYFPNDIDLQRQIQQSLADFEAQMDYPYVSGIVEYVNKIKVSRITTAIVTSSNKEKMDHLYRSHPELPDLFTNIFTAEDTERSKPAPDCYVNAARHLGLKTNECLVFEDSFNGIQAGCASGAKVVGVTTSNSTEAIQGLCDFVIPNFNELCIDDAILKM